jgi:hypothetical protein
MQAGPLLTVALLGGFAAGAMGGALFSSDSSQAVQPLLSTEAGLPTDSSQLEQQIRDLGASQASLEASLEALQNQYIALEGRRREEVLARPEAQNESRLNREELMAAAPFSAEEQARFGAYLDEREAQEQADRDQRRADQRAQRMTDRVARLTEELGLDAYQASEMTRVLTESEKVMTEYFAEMREGGSFDRTGIREKMGEFRQSTTDQLGQFLTTTQLEGYQSSNSSRFGGMGRDARGSGGGNNGGSGNRNSGSNGGSGNRGGF